jgi:hypothetical protein
MEKSKTTNKLANDIPHVQRTSYEIGHLLHTIGRRTRVSQIQQKFIRREFKKSVILGQVCVAWLAEDRLGLP